MSRPAAAGVARWRVAALVTFGVTTAWFVLGSWLSLLARAPLGPALLVYLTFYAFPLVGAVIAWRRPSNRIAWLCLAIGFVWGLNEALVAIVAYALTHPGLVPRPDLLFAIAEPLWVPGVGLMGTFLLLLFPDGHLPLPRWRPLAWLSAIAMIVFYAVFVFSPAEPLGPEQFPGLANPLEVEALGVLEWAVGPLYMGCIAASVVALAQRYRRAAGIERLQLTWLVAAGAAAVFGVLLVNVLLALEVLGAGPADIGDAAIAMLYASIPAAIGVAVLRYRLYEIDRLISRTVTYMVVVGVLGMVYAGGVFVLGVLLPSGNDLAVAASTLATAAFFHPLRKRVQQRVDRRFNRLRYDAALEVQRFAGRLRTAVDLGELTDDLVGVADKTVQPSTATIWLRGGPV